MKVFCLGGAGRICREAAFDLVGHSGFEQITIGDYNLAAAEEVRDWLADERVDAVRIDVTDPADAAAKLKGYDVVADGTQISLNGPSTECIARAGCHGVNLNGFGAEQAFDEEFRQQGRTCVPGFGMTPGVTQMMAMAAANQLDTVDEVYVSHGAFRPIAFSPSITETTVYEYDPGLPTRVVYEDGAFVQVPPFARPRDVLLPEPYGATVQYIIPHAETVTLADALASKGVRLIEVRGTWPQPNMTLISGLYQYGILSDPPVKVGDMEVGLMGLIGGYLQACEAGQVTELYGYALHVEVTGSLGGRRRRATLTHSHPASDGSVEGWEGLRAYTRNVGIPLSIAASLLAHGHVEKTGVITPEMAFQPEAVFAELARRGMHVHEEWEDL
jgi:saccharopine dehydrogenase-like NADP-dependent oxidoreductase